MPGVSTLPLAPSLRGRGDEEAAAVPDKDKANSNEEEDPWDCWKTCRPVR